MAKGSGMRRMDGIPSPIPIAEREWVKGKWGLVCKRKKKDEEKAM